VAVAAGTGLLASILTFGISASVLFGRSQANLKRALGAEKAAAEEAAVAKQVSDFMASLFRVSNPDHSTWEELTAREILERAVERVDAELAEQPRVRSRMLGTLGDTYTGLGRYTEARALHERGLEIKRQVGTDGDPNYAIALHNYGAVLARVGDYEAAIRTHREALAIREARYGPDHGDVAQSLTSLGIVYTELGQFDSSLACQERALEIKKKLFGADDEAVATSTFNLGVLHLKRLDHVKALAHLDEAKRIWTLTLGPDHVRTIQALAAGAGAMKLAGDQEGAREVQRRVVALLEQRLGPSHPEVGVAASNLSGLEQALGNPDEALRLAQRALRIFESTYGPEHLRVAQALGTLADLHAGSGDLKQARELARRGLAILDALALENPATVELLDRLGEIERSLGNERIAASYFTKALDIATRVFGPDHAVVLEIRSKLERPGIEGSSSAIPTSGR
jgi:serine/threonine-protein kinase